MMENNTKMVRVFKASRYAHAIEASLGMIYICCSDYDAFWKYLNGSRTYMRKGGFGYKLPDIDIRIIDHKKYK